MGTYKKVGFSRLRYTLIINPQTLNPEAQILMTPYLNPKL